MSEYPHDEQYMQQGIAELRAALADAEKDAARLMWIADNPVDALSVIGKIRCGDLSAKRWIRSDIDQAMREGGE